MRKKLLSLALALVMCLGLAVPAMAVTISGTPVGDSVTISSIVSQEEVNYCNPVYEDLFQETMYTVDPGTVISFPFLEEGRGESDSYYMTPCDYVNGTLTKLYQTVPPSSANKVTITAEMAGYWYIYARWHDGANNFLEESFLLHVTGDVPVFNFADVVSDAYYAEAVKWAAYRRIANGTGNGNFSPNQTCTNAQILTFIWRAEGKPEPTIANPFTNAIPDAYAKAAVWAYEKGMVSGTTFDMDKPCTRAMAVTYLWQIAGSPDYSEYKTIDFSDVSASAPYAKAVLWAVGWITNGTSDTTFSPEDTCTRGQIMTFLDRCKNSQ